MAILVLHRETPRYIKENCEIEAINIHESSNINYLLDDSAVPNTFQTLELNYLKLDGKKNKNVELINGAWSSDLSGADGVFENVPELIFTFTRKYSSNGLSLWFEKNIFCNDIEILCYNDDELIVSENIYPDSEYVYFEKQITDFNKIHLKFNSINASNRRLRLFRIDFGKSYLFTDGSIAECNIFEEIDYYSTSYIENTASISIKDVNHIFQRGDTVDVFMNGQEINSFVINQIKLVNSDTKQLVCGDALGDYQTMLTDEELISFQDLMLNGIDGFQIRNKFKVNGSLEINLRGTEIFMTPLSFLLMYAFINHGFVSLARGKINLLSLDKNIKKIDTSRIKGEINTKDEYFYKSFVLKSKLPRVDSYFSSGMKALGNGYYAPPPYGETVITRDFDAFLEEGDVEKRYYYCNTHTYIKSRDIDEYQLKILKKGFGWTLLENNVFNNPDGSWPTAEHLILSYYRSEKIEPFEYEYIDNSTASDKLEIQIPLINLVLPDELTPEMLFEAKKNLFLNKYTTTYSFYLILNDEVCGDTIQFQLKTGEEKIGVIQSISMNLQGNKNIAKIEVVCVE